MILMLVAVTQGIYSDVVVIVSVVVCVVVRKKSN